MSARPGTTKWCHVTLATYRNRRLFKIAATARFCERQLARACAARGWQLDTTHVRPDGVQLLVRVPVDVSRAHLATSLKRDIGEALRRSRLLPAWTLRAFGTGHWCSVVTNAAGLQALRRHMRGGGVISTPGSSGRR